MTTRSNVSRSLLIAGLVVGIGAPRAIASAQQPPDLKRASLEDLTQIEVTSVSKKEQKLSEAPSAIVVITQEDLVRSGVTTIAEALRMVPGLAVSQIDANKWAISSRGFTGQYADKMLVLIDGRSVYTPLFAGVFWDVQDTLLADIDRIEVIRGPGATLWGANAVNGVINIITKSAKETHGAHVSALSSSDEHVAFEARYGQGVGSSADVRVFMKYGNREPFLNASGTRAADSWDRFRGGFRTDWKPSPDDGVTVQGEAYGGSTGTTYGPGSLLPLYTTRTTSRSDLGGGHVLGRWTRALSSRSDFSLQAYFDRTTRQEAMQPAERRNTVDVDFYHHTAVFPRQDVVWGAGFRSTSDDIQAGGDDVIHFSPAAKTDNLTNFFVQDEVSVVPNRLRVTGGTKVEHNAYSGWEVQPDARVLVLLNHRQTVWAAVSRAIRTPSRAERDVVINISPSLLPNGVPFTSSLTGNPAFVSETLRAQEIGYRIQPHPRASLDIAAFVNVYDHLRTFEPGAPAFGLTALGPGLIVPVIFSNQMEGDTRGVEITGRLTPTSSSRVDLTYSYLDLTLRHKAGSADTLGILVEDNSPAHQARVHAGVNLGRQIELDGSVAYVGTLRTISIPSYTRVDVRVGWHPVSGLTVAVGGRNLLDAQHPEFASTLGEVPSETPRTGFVSITWRFRP